LAKFAGSSICSGCIDFGSALIFHGFRTIADPANEALAPPLVCQAARRIRRGSYGAGADPRSSLCGHRSFRISLHGQIYVQGPNVKSRFEQC
jgi:hypothetical protein